MNYHLISSILKGVWALDQNTALSYAPLINNVIGNSPIAFEFDQANFSLYSIDRASAVSSGRNSLSDAPQRSIAVIPLSGPLMKNDQSCGPIGMATIGNYIKEADSNPNIDGIILKIDSPGGTVDGTVALAEIVSNTSKPIIAFADGLIASAALWIGASADEIIASTNKTEIGSVGVLLNFADVQPAYEKLGVKFHQITADQSTDKTNSWENIRKGDYEAYKKDVLNPIAADFINHIKNKLPGATDDQLTGKVFFAENVVGSLVASIGNFNHAVSRMNELINENSNSISNPKSNNATMKTTFSAINKVVGADLQATDEGIFLNEQQLEAIEQNLAIQNSVSNEETVVDVAETATQENTATETAIDPKDKVIADLQKTVATLQATTATDNDVAKDNDTKINSEPDDFMSNIQAARELYEAVN